MQQGQRERAPASRQATRPDPALRGPVLSFDAWDRMALAPYTPQPRGVTVIAPALAAALDLIDCGFTDTHSGPAGCYAVPSAGAVYPYEFAVIIAEQGRPAVFHADPLRRRIARLAAPDSAGALLNAAGLALPSRSGALIAIIARPWLSIRKYGDRGYLYTQLDSAHVAVNLLGVAAERFSAGLRLRFGREALAELLTVAESCREVHSVLRIEPAAHSGSAAGRPQVGPPAWQTSGSGPEKPSWLERMCWESLCTLVPDSADAVRQPDTYQHTTADLPGSADGTPTPAQQWSELSYRRRSSKGFRPGTVPVGDVTRILAMARAPLAVDTMDTTGFLDAAGLRTTLVARSISGLVPGAYHLSVAHGTAPFGSEPPTSAVRYTPVATAASAMTGGTDEEIVRACMHQEHLGTCAAAVLFHAERDKIVGRAPTAMRDLMFRAGGLAQLYYLGARSRSVGVTAVGGFDSARWRALAGLDEDQELLYLLLLGVDGGPGVKWDRLQTAYPQGEE